MKICIILQYFEQDIGVSLEYNCSVDQRRNQEVGTQTTHISGVFTLLCTQGPEESRVKTNGKPNITINGFNVLAHSQIQLVVTRRKSLNTWYHVINHIRCNFLARDQLQLITEGTASCAIFSNHVVSRDVTCQNKW